VSFLGTGSNWTSTPFCADFRFLCRSDFLCKALARIGGLRRTNPLPRVVLTVPQARGTVSETSVQNLRDDADCAGIAQPRMRQDLDRVRIR
jgi:hypothetical protein